MEFKFVVGIHAEIVETHGMGEMVGTEGNSSVGWFTVFMKSIFIVLCVIDYMLALFTSFLSSSSVH